MCKKVLLIGLFASMSAQAMFSGKDLGAVSNSNGQQVTTNFGGQHFEPTPRFGEQELEPASNTFVASGIEWLKSDTPEAKAVAVGLALCAAKVVADSLWAPVSCWLNARDRRQCAEQRRQCAEQLGEITSQLGIQKEQIDALRDSSVIPAALLQDRLGDTSATPALGVTNEQFENLLKEFAALKAATAHTDSNFERTEAAFKDQTELEELLTARLIALERLVQNSGASTSVQTAGSSSGDGAKIADLAKQIADFEKHIASLTASVHQSNQTKADKLTMFTQKLETIEQRLAVDESQLKAFQDKSSGYKSTQSADNNSADKQ